MEDQLSLSLLQDESLIVAPRISDHTPPGTQQKELSAVYVSQKQTIALEASPLLHATVVADINMSPVYTL